jgi:magnesium transporter
MLVAGIYGMNFKYIPELEWEFGYVYVLILIVLSFISPLLWFKKKKWF